jgi:leucyl aminopeptidase
MSSTSSTSLSAVAPGAYAADALILGVNSTPGGPSLVGGASSLGAERVSALQAQLKQLGFKGAANAVVAVPGGADEPVHIFVGLGDAEPKAEALRRAAGAAVRAAGDLAGSSVAVLLPAADSAALTAVAEGASLGAYAWNKYKTKNTTTPVASIQIVSAADAAAETVRRAEVAARHVKGARDLVNSPPCDLYPASYAERVLAATKDLAGVTVEIWDEARLAEEKMGGILAVGAGSSRPPRLVKIAYTPSAAGTYKHLAIVGKGITFDSGGISIKPSPKMHEMKGDMGGSAAALHAVLAAAELRVRTRVTAWLCLAENMPSGAALKNGDVIVQRTGTTVECHNTDAEGRLVLADGLAVAQARDTGYGTEDADPDVLLDIATLTGAQLAALGARTAGLMGDDAAVKAVQAAAAASGEQFWAMPFPDELLEDLKSTTADLKNIGSVPYGGMLKAGVFVSSEETGLGRAPRSARAAQLRDPSLPLSLSLFANTPSSSSSQAQRATGPTWTLPAPRPTLPPPGAAPPPRARALASAPCSRLPSSLRPSRMQVECR